MRLGAFLMVCLCLACGAATADEPGRVFRVGFLWLGRQDGAGPGVTLASFRAGMRDLGYVEGRNLKITVRDGHGEVDRLDRAAAELVTLKVDLIVTSGTAPSLAAEHATTKIPIVFGGSADPVGRGVVESLAHPGSNITGFARELAFDKAMGVLAEIKSGEHRLGLVFHSRNMPAAYIPVFLAERSEAARKLGMTLVPEPVSDAEPLKDALADMSAKGVDVALITNDTFFMASQGELMAWALEHHVATGCLSRFWAQAGCLASYGEDESRLYRQAATVVDKILRGAKPADIPVQQSTTFTLTINRKTAQALGLTIPPSVLALADEVLE
jgi:putative tryptophan/tyrosine transport system substrate-binding protein